MDQFVNVHLAIDKVNTIPQRALDCRPGFGGLNHSLYLQVCYDKQIF